MTILSEMAERLRETNAMLSQRAAKNAVKEIEENLTWAQRLADKVAELNGSWAFILFLLGLTAVWTIANIPSVAIMIGLTVRGTTGRSPASTRTPSSSTTSSSPSSSRCRGRSSS